MARLPSPTLPLLTTSTTYTSTPTANTSTTTTTTTTTIQTKSDKRSIGMGLATTTTTTTAITIPTHTHRPEWGAIPRSQKTSFLERETLFLREKSFLCQECSTTTPSSRFPPPIHNLFRSILYRLISKYNEILFV